jgi:signal transduction histidine kinase
VAHEINTPLTGISSYAELLVEELAAGDPRRETLRKILAQSRRASTIANSLLTLARPERTRFEEIDLNDTVREALQLFEPQIRGRDVKLQARLDPAQPRVRGHRGKLQQVLLNLLLNARDAVDDGGEIVVNSYRLDDRVMLEVADDGQGIAEEDLPRIFDPFFTTKGRGNGTGLGLSITYGIVQEHAGRIEVDSVPGRLTRFRIALPAAVPVRMIAR